jgi:hypothetical protein
MRARVSLFLLLIGILRVAIFAQDILTNDSILEMVKGGLGENVIIGMIRDRPGNYVLTHASLLNLKRKGFSDNILAAMVSHNSGKTPAKPADEPTPPPPATHQTSRPMVSGDWVIREQKDAMSGYTNFVATSILPAESGEGPNGQFRVSAECRPNVYLALYVSYSPLSGKVVLKRTTVQRPTSSTGLGTSAMAINSCTLMRLRIDDGLIKDAVSETCDSDNLASILFEGDFADLMNMDEAKQMLEPSAQIMKKMAGQMSPRASDEIRGATNRLAGQIMPTVDSMRSLSGLAAPQK